MMKKGISLPVETIVIVAVVVLVLVVVTVFFISGSGQQFATISDDSAFGKGCVELGTVKNCKFDTSKEATLKSIKIGGYDRDLDKDGKAGTLLDACTAKGYAIADICWKACGCSG